MTKRLIGEPLVHFLLIGAGLFGLSHWASGSAGGDADRIVITRSQVAALKSGFESAWQRQPSDAELAALIQDYAKEEVSVREATALGLDRGDAIMRQRLRQKFEFLSEDSVEAKPSDAELQAYLAAHPDSFGVEGRLPAIDDVRDSVTRAWSADRRRERIEARYRALLARYKVVVEEAEP